MNQVEKNIKPEFDHVLQRIADYVLDYNIESELAYQTAYLCLLDSLGCAMLALQYQACTKVLGPYVEGTQISNGAQVPGTTFQLDPVQAAFNFGTMIRWLDYNDTWLAAEWGHPSDNLGSILMVADYLCRSGQKNVSMHDVLTAMIKAHEIQGIFALENSFNRVGLDHVILVKIASTAVVAHMLGANREQLLNALSLAFVDGQSLRTYRHAPNAGTRKSWAAGDATARAVFLALMAMKGEMGYPSCLSAPIWGFYDVLFDGNQFKFNRPFTSYVMENVLFKISFPAEFHAQTAVECAVTLHPEIRNRLDDIERIDIETHESAIRIISKEGALHNPADRDHCLQYMIAIGLLHGNLSADHYEDNVASDPRIDELRTKMHVSENERFSREYLEQDKRSIANSLQIFFKDGTHSEKVTVEYPIGHRLRREEGKPVLIEKFKQNMHTQFDDKQATHILHATSSYDKVCALSAQAFVDLFMS